MPRTKKVETVKNRPIKDKDFVQEAHNFYQAYGTAVVEDRAVADGLDGCKPVVRRSLWAAYNIARSTNPHIKTARLVGEVIGRYHPHGDASVNDTIAKYMGGRSAFPLFDPSGGWGSFSNPAYSAMRYNATRLHPLAEEVLFDPHYLAVTDMVSNYDGTTQEPVVLPALVPTILLNNKMGMSPGVISLGPEFEFSSIVDAIVLRVAQKDALTAEQLEKTLKFTSRYEGSVERKFNTRANSIQVMKTGVGRIRFESTLTTSVVKGKTTILNFTKFAPIPELETLLPKLLNIEGVQDAYDNSSRSDVHGTLTVVLKPNLDQDSKAAIRVKTALSATRNYATYVTERTLGDDEVLTQLRKKSIVSIFEYWYQWRIELEKRAALHWQQECDKRIAKIDLQILACSKLDFLVAAIKSKRAVPELEQYISKGLKITIVEAQYLLSRTLLQLRALNLIELKAEKQKELDLKKKLSAWYKKPTARIQDVAQSLDKKWKSWCSKHRAHTKSKST